MFVEVSRLLQQTLTDKMWWLQSSIQRCGCPIVQGARMRDRLCQRQSLILMHRVDAREMPCHTENGQQGYPWLY